MSTNFVVDLGSSKVAAVCGGNSSKGVFKVQGSGFATHQAISKGAIIDEDLLAEAISSAVKDAASAAGTEPSAITIGLSGPQIKGSSSQGVVPLYPNGRTITHEDVFSVVRHSTQVALEAGFERIMSLPREFCVDGKRGILHPVGLVGSELQVINYIVTAPTALLTQIEKVVSKAGYKVEQFVPNALGSASATMKLEDAENGVVIIDIGAACTEVAVFKNRGLADAFYLPVGSRHISSDIATLLKASPEEGDRLKISQGLAMGSLADEKETVEVRQVDQDHPRPMQRKVLGEIIESRVREIAKLCHRHLEERGHLELIKSGLLLTGGGTLLSGTDTVFASVFPTLSVRVVQPGLDLKLPNGESLTASIGLARYCASDEAAELSTVGGNSGWRGRVSAFWSLFAPK